MDPKIVSAEDPAVNAENSAVKAGDVEVTGHPVVRLRLPQRVARSPRGRGAHVHGGGHSHGGHGGHAAHGGHGGHGPVSGSTALLVGMLLNSVFVAVEFAYGTVYQSTALLADAAHNLGDVTSLALAWIATRLAARRPSERRTYGLRRATVLAALGNAMLLLVAVGGIGWEAITRFAQPAAVNPVGVMYVAAAGVVVNGVSALLLAGGGREDVNLRAAFLHMAADAAISLGVVLAGALVLWTHATWVDSLASLSIAAIISVSSFGLLREAMNLALDAVPSHVDPLAVRQYLEQLPDVLSVHDLHIWSMSTTEHALTAHLVIHWEAVPPAFLQYLDEELERRFGIQHATVQLEHSAVAPNCRGVVPGAL